MQFEEIGLSTWQRIRESAFSGYIERGPGTDPFVIEIEIAESFDGDGWLEIVLIGDGDDGFYAPSEYGKMGPFRANELTTHSVFQFVCDAMPERFMCLWYRIRDANFIKGKVHARVLPKNKADILPDGCGIVEYDGA